MADGSPRRRLVQLGDDYILDLDQPDIQRGSPLRDVNRDYIWDGQKLCSPAAAPQEPAGQHRRPAWQSEEDVRRIDAVLLGGTLHQRLRLHAISKGAGRLGLRLPISKPRPASAATSYSLRVHSYTGGHSGFSLFLSLSV